MKKLIGLFVVLFITTGVFGQKFIRSHSFIETTPTGNNTIEDAIRSWNITGGDYDWIKYVHFVQNGRIYMLAYEPNEKFTSGNKIMAGTTRDIYLYSKDTADVNSPWEQASEIVMTSLWNNIRDYGEVDFFRSELSRGSKGEVIVDGDKVYITIGLEIMTNGGESINEPITFGFELNKNDETYYKFLSYQQPL